MQDRRLRNTPLDEAGGPADTTRGTVTPAQVLAPPGAAEIKTYDPLIWGLAHESTSSAEIGP